MCGCCVRIRAGISVRVRIRVRDGVRISNRVKRRVKLVNYSLLTALSIATSADPHIRLSAFYPWPVFTPRIALNFPDTFMTRHGRRPAGRHRIHVNYRNNAETIFGI